MTTTTAPTALETLRDMYRAVRAGGTLDAQGYADAILAVIADGEDAQAVKQAFQKLGYSTNLRVLGLSNGAGARVRAAKEAHGWCGAMRVASALGLSDVWSAAMAAHCGPTWTHESLCRADGVPTIEAMEEFPEIGAAMSEAAERFENLTGYYDRYSAGRGTQWDQVVESAHTAHCAACTERRAW